MRILHIVPSYYPAHRYGGPIQSVHNLNKDLVKQGADVTVYTTSADGPDDLQVPYGVPVDCDGVKVYYFKLGLFRSWFYSCTLHKMLAKNAKDFDIIHITSVFLFASTLGAYYAKKYKKPYIISPRGSLMKEPLSRKSTFLKKIYLACIEKNNLKNADAIHFTSSQEEKEYKEEKFPVKGSFLIPNSFDIVDFKKEVGKGTVRRHFGIPDNAPLVLFLSRISWKKGFDTLIPAFKNVRDAIPDAKLLIAGGDEEGYKKNVGLLITNYKLQNDVIFTGMLLGDDKIGAYKDANVFVLPSYSENFGMVVVEALALGIPTIITEGVALSSEIKKENIGIVVKKDVRELSNAIISVLQHPEKFSKMTEQGREFVARKFSPEIIAKKFAEVYEEIIYEKGK